MRLDNEDLKKVTGRTVDPIIIKAGSTFIDPWGVVWRANADATETGAAPGHVIVRATQLIINDDGAVKVHGDKVNTEIPCHREVKILHPDTWIKDLEELFHFDSEE
jgi:hypothetical protein